MAGMEEAAAKIKARPKSLWVFYAKWTLFFCVTFQVVYDTVSWGPFDQRWKDAILLQIFAVMISTDIASLLVTIDYAKRAEAQIELFDKGAFVLGKVFTHHTLRGLTEDQAAQKVVGVLDQIEQVKPILSNLGKVKPQHLERGIRLLNIILSASDRLTDEQIGHALGKKVEQAVTEMQEAAK